MTWRVQRQYRPERLDWLYVVDFGVGTENHRHLSIYAETDLGIDINGPAGNDGLDNLFVLLQEVCKEMNNDSSENSGETQESYARKSPDTPQGEPGQ